VEARKRMMASSRCSRQSRLVVSSSPLFRQVWSTTMVHAPLVRMEQHAHPLLVAISCTERHTQRKRQRDTHNTSDRGRANERLRRSQDTERLWRSLCLHHSETARSGGCSLNIQSSLDIESSLCTYTTHTQLAPGSVGTHHSDPRACGVGDGG